ncbi:MAG: GGDEF domain-containing protein [Spirochaetes bacterium]|nr:GGDEF domain-containing protein [Spirochaetota bacterium]
MPGRVIQTIENIELDILADIDDSDVFRFVLDSLRHETGSPYAALTEAILHYDIAEEEAKLLWSDILGNKEGMEKALGRAVSIKTALVDHFTAKRQKEKIIIFIKDNMISAFDTAMRDGLTGLYSHAIIHAELEKEFQTALRYDLDLSVIFIDIDDFKGYNDSYGHIAGDRVLVMVGRVLTENLRMTDKIGRYGGEEFLIVLPHTSLENAAMIAEKLRASIEEESASAGELTRGVTVSVGVSEIGEDTKDGHDLINDADIRMYRAKKEGKNRVCCDDHPRA